MLSFQTVFPDTLELLMRLTALPMLSDTRLVGGTALALQLGHRRSVDLDFFGCVSTDTNSVIAELNKIGRVGIISCTETIRRLTIDDVKVDIVDYSDVPWIDGAVVSDNLRLASLRDIAAMKMNAIVGRGSRKDFVDLYFLLQHFSFSDIMDCYRQKYPAGTDYRAMMSSVYFKDAEIQPMPEMFSEATWDMMKSFIKRIVDHYNRKQIQ
ncbi:MAG: nucleotidyl transferase AbiEii/AbiGii toxin family protein [Alloprevotella sp.]|nr:nucleotidyl transferase AbiEii/AbiGii toxin family protein [Alloprevotella sp.]